MDAREESFWSDIERKALGLVFKRRKLWFLAFCGRKF
jgi:hypothetical protein